MPLSTTKLIASPIPPKISPTRPPAFLRASKFVTINVMAAPKRKIGFINKDLPILTKVVPKSLTPPIASLNVKDFVAATNNLLWSAAPLKSKFLSFEPTLPIEFPIASKGESVAKTAAASEASPIWSASLPASFDSLIISSGSVASANSAFNSLNLDLRDCVLVTTSSVFFP